jgi:hypothetical protein
VQRKQTLNLIKLLLWVQIFLFLHFLPLFQQVNFGLHFPDYLVFFISCRWRVILIALDWRWFCRLGESCLQLSILSHEVLHNLLIHIGHLPAWWVVYVRERFRRWQRTGWGGTWPAINLLCIYRLTAN